ncbi:MAG: glycosyltransferase family 39 protein, partial [Desulfobulbaceae bacterium]|nr:glycosyltransferase family 39 protein [Desulfobulbaceae bacterium]
LAEKNIVRSCSDPWQWLAVLAIVVGTIWLRWHLLDVSLERDEGEYAYGGQLLLQGVPPYQLLYNMKLPGIYAVYAVILAVFGNTQTGIHLGLLCANVASIVLLFLLGRRIAGPFAGICAGALFAVLSVGQAVQGVFANAEHFVLVPVLFGALILSIGLDLKRSWLIFFSGVLLGIGVLIKQHGALFALWAGFFVVVEGIIGRYQVRQVIRSVFILTLGTLLPYGLTCLLLLKAGVFEQFWFWTIDYARAYATQVPWSAAWANMAERVSVMWWASPLPWAASGFGVLVCLVR